MGLSSTRTVVSTALEAVLVLVAAGLHLAAAEYNDVLPPYGALETGVVALPLLGHAVALVLLLVRRDRRGLQGACLLQGLLVLYLLPAGSEGVSFLPAALALVLAVWRPWLRVSSGPAAGA